ncbi:MAG: hypothetical protein WCA49_22570 [Candidatus Sulfotelmatobacter sp.]
MKTTMFAGSLLTILLLTISGFTQENPAAVGCGDPKAKFDVKTEHGQHSAQPEAGKALLYFIEDDSNFWSNPKPTTRMGIDGEWVGATHGSSYFYVPVDPGVHHLCASWQTTVVLGRGHMTSAAHFAAEAGSVYYFVVKDIWTRDGQSDMSLNPLDSDEGLLLANKFSFSTFHSKN